MKFGLCCDTSITALAARESYDFAEGSVAGLLKPRESEDAFRASLDALRAAKLPYPVVNCFIPGDLKITGAETDESALKAFVKTAMERAERAGVQVIVFGSGGARHIPDGFDPRKAHEQIAAFCRLAAPLARNHGVTIAVEPLNKAVCNVLNTVDECAQIVREVAHPAIRLLVDAYHLMLDNDSYDDIVKHGKLLAHVHIATVPGGLSPGAEPCDFSRFFGALAEANYTGRVSIEAKISNPEAELPAALAIMRKSAGH